MSDFICLPVWLKIQKGAVSLFPICSRIVIKGSKARFLTVVAWHRFVCLCTHRVCRYGIDKPDEYKGTRIDARPQRSGSGPSTYAVAWRLQSGDVQVTRIVKNCWALLMLAFSMESKPNFTYTPWCLDISCSCLIRTETGADDGALGQQFSS